jgi:signal transduction histidine kinase/CHASE1-domain containing sensor protein/CheY-like chemotaxis protein
VSWQLDRSIDQQDRERFEAAASNLQESISARLDTYVAILRAGAGLVAASEVVSASEFHAFVERLGLRSRYPGIQGVGYSVRIPASRLDAVVAGERRTRPEFRVWPEDPRDEYHAILYLEPLDRRNAAAIGYDMFTESTRRAAMERARDSGEAAASGLVTLVQEIDETKRPGFLIYVPIYDDGLVPTSVEERRRRLRGFVYSPFRADDLFAGILGRHPNPRVGVALYDTTKSAATLVYRTSDPASARFTSEGALDVFGRRWVTTMFSTPGLEQTSSVRLLPFFTWGGVAISFVLAGLALLQARARRRAEQSEAAAAAASRSLQQQADTLRVINRTGTDLAGELELDRLVQTVTDAATSVTRAQFGAFFYNRLNDAGESEMLYALSGTSSAESANFPLPRNSPVFTSTFMGEGVVRSDDLQADPRYADNPSFDGMPRGPLPVRSYLAVPVKSRSGEVLGGLFLGHVDRGVFTEQSEQIVGGIAAQTAIAIDNARLYGRVQQLLGSERAARTEAERVSRMKDEFLAVLSHELRTPLNAVMGWAHMFKSGALPEEKRAHALDSILRNARAQSRLIEDLLDMSRIISGRLSLELAALDLREVVDAAVNVVRPSAAAKSIELTTSCPKHPLPVRADAGRLQQIVWNLLTNAIKFTPANGQVHVELRDRGATFELAVTDTGLGIDPEFAPHVFDRFRQADASSTRGHGGLGLGLSIVRSLVELHRGTVSVRSDGLNQGATFTVSLPRADAAVAGVPAIEGAHNDAAPDVFQRLRGCRILVVDDDRDGRELVAEVLQQYGAEVAVAGTADDALARLRNDSSVHLIVSDVGMPDMDGYEFIGRVRESSSPLRHVPAIALTAYAGGEDRARAIAAGYNVHLSKPFNPNALVRACATLCAAGA